MEIILWSVIFIISLTSLVKGADWLIDGAENLGVAIGFSPFVVGVTIVALGTSLPELMASFSAVFKNTPEIVVANAIGSNIANILLIVGISTIIGHKMVVKKDLIDLDLPLLMASTVLFLMVAWDGGINIFESIVLLSSYVFYLMYVLLHKPEKEIEERAEAIIEDEIERKNKFEVRDFVAVSVGAILLALGAHYLVESVLELSSFLGLSAGVITITVVALGTSLPELSVSIKATLKNKAETALGNIFGSNVFNLLVVVGLPGLISELPLEDKVMNIGLPVLIMATLLFVISGISKKINNWEGTFYVVIYIVFIVKLLGLF